MINREVTQTQNGHKMDNKHTHTELNLHPFRFLCRGICSFPVKSEKQWNFTHTLTHFYLSFSLSQTHTPSIWFEARRRKLDDESTALTHSDGKHASLSWHYSLSPSLSHSEAFASQHLSCWDKRVQPVPAANQSDAAFSHDLCKEEHMGYPYITPRMTFQDVISSIQTHLCTGANWVADIYFFLLTWGQVKVCAYMPRTWWKPIEFSTMKHCQADVTVCMHEKTECFLFTIVSTPGCCLLNTTWVCCRWSHRTCNWEIQTHRFTFFRIASFSSLG